MKKIRSKILVAIIGCVLIMSSVVSALILVKSVKSLHQQAMDNIKALADVHGKDLNNNFIRAEAVVDNLKLTLQSMVDEESLKANPDEYEKELVPIFKNLNNGNSGYMGIYVAFNPQITKDVHEIFFEDVNGKGQYARIENDTLEDFNPSNPIMAWYYEAIKMKRGVWSNPYFDEFDSNTKVEIISYTEPIYKNGVLLGVVGIDLNYNKDVKPINKVKDENGVTTFLLNDKYDYIADSKYTYKDNLSNIEGGKYKNLTDEFKKNSNGYIECYFDGKMQIIGYAHLANQWIVVTTIPVSVIYQGMKSGIAYALIAVIVGLVISSRVAIAVSKKISYPVVLATNFAEELASGNLAEKLYITSGDETETLAKSLNKASENISNLIEELKATEEELTYQVEELKKSEETISTLAYKNPITEMWNRNYAAKYIPQVLVNLKENNGQGALFWMNIDNFKMINDTLGHSSGDEFLLVVSKLLKNLIKSEQILSHFGGDEFIFFLPFVKSIDEVREFAEKVLNIFRQAIIVDGYEILYSTASMGISLFPSNGTDVETLFKNADTALNNAKNKGKNTYRIFDEKMNLKISEKLQLENNLSLALSNKEFQVYYQPKVEVKTGKVVSMEALIRWISPTLGIVSPVKFIPLAEETGLILPIGEFVLREACRQNKIWHQKGFTSLKVAVNLSARQLKNNLVSMIKNVLEETGLEPECLELEITESILMNNFDNGISILKQLKNLGVGIYLDDFGTGYSSLNYLRKLPIDSIKIDKSFIDGLTENANDSFIASSLIKLAHGIGLSVVAEGVESLEQFSLLKNYECDQIQGYYFSKPLNTEDFEKYLEKNS